MPWYSRSSSRSMSWGIKLLVFTRPPLTNKASHHWSRKSFCFNSPCYEQDKIQLILFQFLLVVLVFKSLFCTLLRFRKLPVKWGRVPERAPWVLVQAFSGSLKTDTNNTQQSKRWAYFTLQGGKKLAEIISQLWSGSHRGMGNLTVH